MKTTIPLRAGSVMLLLFSCVVAQSCSDIKYDVLKQGCYQFIGLGSWNEEFVSSICSDHGDTDKSITASLCSESADNADYASSLKLAILNTMYGTGPITDECQYYCMYDPFNVEGLNSVVFIWQGNRDCWKVATGGNSPLCYIASKKEHDWAIIKTNNWCPGSVCEVHGDPHIWNFDGIELGLIRHSVGDYLLYYSTTLRIDIRLRQYYTNSGQLWGSVTGVHASVIEIINGDCDMKIEVYSKYQTESGELLFLVNEEEVGWDALSNRFANCEEICPGKYEVDEAGGQFLVTFADGVMLTVTNVEHMQGLFLTVPYRTIAYDTYLIEEDQLCTDQYRLLKTNCENDTSIFTNNDLSCNETITPPPTSIVCEDPNIRDIASQSCSCEEYEIDCSISSLVDSCEFDVCASSGVQSAWDAGDEARALEEAMLIADPYCELSVKQLDNNPWLCGLDPTSRPTKSPVPLPTRLPTNSPSLDPTPLPTNRPSIDPTNTPTETPTTDPTPKPTQSPTIQPTENPTPFPTSMPTQRPTPNPTASPTLKPSPLPTPSPTDSPTSVPTGYPTEYPTLSPTQTPTVAPTWSPTSYLKCAYLVYENRECLIDSYDVYLTVIVDHPNSETGVQNCAQRCFREGSDWLQYMSGTCHCIFGTCRMPLRDSQLSTYRIMDCDLVCDEVSSKEWWGQDPTSVEHINSIASMKTVKGIRFTSEINARVHTMGIEMLLDSNGGIPDSRIRPYIFMAGENRTVASGQSIYPSSVEGAYDGRFGHIAMVFLEAAIRSTVVYTASFEFLYGEVNIMVSENTHYFHDGALAHEVFAVKGSEEGKEPNEVDLKAPHVVFCYVAEGCIPKDTVWSTSKMHDICPEGFGDTDKTITEPCLDAPFLAIPIQKALLNKQFVDCTSACIFDTDWPYRLSFRWHSFDQCWDPLLGDNNVCAILNPEFALEMFNRADLYCVNMTEPTPLPTVPPTDRTICTLSDINSGSHALVSIDSAYPFLDEICSVIDNATAKLDGGYIFGETCEANKTDYILSYDVMICATAATYCDFGDVLLSPDFADDTDINLLLVKLLDMLIYHWGGPLSEWWGVEVTIISSLRVNAAGLYLNHLTQNEMLWFRAEDGTGETMVYQSMGNGKNSHASWYYSVLTEEIEMEAGLRYKLLFTYPSILDQSGAAYMETKIRVYSSVQMPFTIEDAFTVDNLMLANTVGYTSSNQAAYLPFISVKYCKDLPTAAPTLVPTSSPTPSPTDECWYIDVNLVGYDETLYDLPSWFDVFGGQYKFMKTFVNIYWTYEHVDGQFTIYRNQNDWWIHDRSQTSNYDLVLSLPADDDALFPTLDVTTTWSYSNDQGVTNRGDVDLLLTCDSSFPPTSSPIGPTEAPSLTKTPCAILEVTTEEDHENGFRYNGMYYIQSDPNNYEFRSSKNQWYRDHERAQGHIYWMDNESPLWPNAWVIYSQAGYLVLADNEADGIDTISSIIPESSRFDVYKTGELSSNDEATVEILCATEPPTSVPTSTPTSKPTAKPTPYPTKSPTVFPSANPTTLPTTVPTPYPTKVPTRSPSQYPTHSPTPLVTPDPTPSPTFEEPCEYYKLSSDDFDEFEGNYQLMRLANINDNVLDKRNEAPQWENSESGYVMYYLSEGLFANRWTIQSYYLTNNERENEPVTTQDYYIVSPELENSEDTNNPPRGSEWQVFSMDTWHIIGDFFMTVELECHNTSYPTLYPTYVPTSIPTRNHSCILLNYTTTDDAAGSWLGIYTIIEEPALKNGKVHYAGPQGHELFWMEDGIFGQRWILACANGTILSTADTADSTSVPSNSLWRQIMFSDCDGHCIDFGSNFNLTVTNLETCGPTSAPSPKPTITPTAYPSELPSVKPTVTPTMSPSVYQTNLPTPSPSKLPTTPLPSPSPSLMPSPAPSAGPTGTTPEPTEHPTFNPTESPTNYPTYYCECLHLILSENDVYLMTRLADRNRRHQWVDGESGWSLYWAVGGLYDGTWILQGADYDVWYSVAGRQGDGMPPSVGNWQEFFTGGYNLASDVFKSISLNCTECEETSAPTSPPTSLPTRHPTSSPTCSENYIALYGCCDDEFEGVYYRHVDKKNGKHWYTSSNGYSVYYVHDGMFPNHWVCQSPDNDYFYLNEHSEIGDEPMVSEELEWLVFRGASFSYIRKHNITVYCAYSDEPTRNPTRKPSPIPTKTPTRSPSPSPTVFPTLLPSPVPSALPTPSPSPMPSVLPTKRPTKVSVTTNPSSFPSLLPSTSPTKLTTTLEPTPSSKEPTQMPSPSPTKLPTSWCSCISAESNYTAFNGIFMHNGLTHNQHYEWSDADGNRLYWEDDIYDGSSWVIRVAREVAVYEHVNPDWINTPPLSTEMWTIYDIGVVIDGGSATSLTLSCTTCEPTSRPTHLPTGAPSLMPSPSPTLLPTTRNPTLSPSMMPTPRPTKLPTTQLPSTIPTYMPTPAPSARPSVVPTASPSEIPATLIPTPSPSLLPSPSPSAMPSSLPTPSPSRLPTTPNPSSSPSVMPSPFPSSMPSIVPSPSPSSMPSTMPSPSPSKLPTTQDPSASPSLMPTLRPTALPTTPTPSESPSIMPSPSPSLIPSTLPSPSPTMSPVLPTMMPSQRPTSFPTVWCSCITVETTTLGFAGTYEASGHVVNQHYHWETADAKSIYWGYGLEQGDSWVIAGDSSAIAAFGGDVNAWSNTPPLLQRPWQVFQFRQTTGTPTNFTLSCTTCNPTNIPTSYPTPPPTTPLPSPRPSAMPSPSPSGMPSIIPTPLPTKLPTSATPSSSPSSMPSPSPTKLPTSRRPSQSPSALPSPSPSSKPSIEPSPAPTHLPTTQSPSPSPSLLPSSSPTKYPTTAIPTFSPSSMPSPSPSAMPSTQPTPNPSKLPTTRLPSLSPSLMPSQSPTKLPTTTTPSHSPSQMPSPSPSLMPSSAPSPAPTKLPTTLDPTPLSAGPTLAPTVSPSDSPTIATPSHSPSMMPSPSPSSMPSSIPTPSPTKVPTTSLPSLSPSLMPSPSPSQIPSSLPSPGPTALPTTPLPSTKPSLMPSPSPTKLPTTRIPSLSPSSMPSPAPSSMPSLMPTPSPTKLPTTRLLSRNPSSMPSPSPTFIPSTMPTPAPTKLPTTPVPSRTPSAMPSPSPTKMPTTPILSASPSLMPSPSPSLMPSSGPSPSPSNLPTLTTATNSPSIMPSPSPSAFPTTPIPSSSPSQMPSPSPSPMPSALPSPAPSEPPSIPPTKSPLEYYREYCRCLLVTTSGTDLYNFNGEYQEHFKRSSGNWVWRKGQGQTIKWNNNHWMIRGENDTTAFYEVSNEEWTVTPPLEMKDWEIHSDQTLFSSIDMQLRITITCVECTETEAPTRLPTIQPSVRPTSSPSPKPSVIPTPTPTILPTTLIPTMSPSLMPSLRPTSSPIVPTSIPSTSPTTLPTTLRPSSSPSLMPSLSPSKIPTTAMPSLSASLIPTPAPSPMPSAIPSPSPTDLPTVSASSPNPSVSPSRNPTQLPTTPTPSLNPSSMPSSSPSSMPSSLPTLAPSKQPTNSSPSLSPSIIPSTSPSQNPSIQPSPSPSRQPTSLHPTLMSSRPTQSPTSSPSSAPSVVPTPSPTNYPTSWCNCITVNATQAVGFQGTYMASGLVINQHYHWVTNDERELYWEKGNWVITGEGGMYALYEDPSEDWLNTPPLDVSQWDVYSDGILRDLFYSWIELKCDTCLPTLTPTKSPSLYPTTPLPTASPSPMPSPSPSFMPSALPSPTPTKLPTTSQPTLSPSMMPSPSPSDNPVVPTSLPSISPSASPSTPLPSSSPSQMPSLSPSALPTTVIPSSSPSSIPTPSPSTMPSLLPTPAPTKLPTTPTPSSSPSLMPSPSPTILPTASLPSPSPSLVPSPTPSTMPSSLPSPSPTKLPTTQEPSLSPSMMPSPSPSTMPSTLPTPSPTGLPTTRIPSQSPSQLPSPSPTQMPSLLPTRSPSQSPTETLSPTHIPTISPTVSPSTSPTWSPTVTIACVSIHSEYGEANGTYIRLPGLIGGKTSWANGQVELFFDNNGVFEGTWVIRNKITDDYLVYVKDGSYKGDSYPPLESDLNWQLFSNGGLVPGRNFVKVIIDAETTCQPTFVPTKAPTELPTAVPTGRYLCVIATWDTNDEAYNDVPVDFYGSYYYNDMMSASDNDFSKFPIYPSTVNNKPIFTKKQNSNSLSFVSNDQANASTWVFASEDHNNYLTSTLPNEDHQYPVFSEYPVDVNGRGSYEWSLFLDGTYSEGLGFSIAMSSNLDVCGMFDTPTPTKAPTGYPTISPTPIPSVMPTPVPSPMPSVQPTPAPSSSPSSMPSLSPTNRPTSQLPTSNPTPYPTQYPTLTYQCINITAVDSNFGHYDGVYTVNADTLNGRAWFTNGNTGFDLYYVPAAVMIDNAWVLEGSSNDKMSIYDVDVGTWTQYGRSDDVPPYGTFFWKEFSVPPNPSSFDEIYLSFVPLLNCVPTQGPTKAPTNLPTTSTPAPTTPSPTIVPTLSPSDPPTTSPTATPTSDPTKVCRVLVVVTPEEPGGTSVFAGSYLMQSTFKNGKFQWFNSNNGYRIFFVDDEWLPSSWVFKGDDGMDEIVVFDEGSDGHPNTVTENADGVEYFLFYWGRNLQKRDRPILVQIYCIDSFPPTKIPTPGPSLSPSVRPTSIPSPSPSLYPSSAPSSMPSVIPTPSPSAMPSVVPSSSPTRRPTLPTAYPTSLPSNPPTSFPTEICPCIFVASTDFPALEGMYQLEDENVVWVNYDNNADIHKSYDVRFMQSWLITASGIVAATEDTSGRWGYTPPIGTEVWTVYERGFTSGGSRKELNLECTTCLPTPAPTHLPTPISTPSPTTPFPTTVPTLSPSEMPSTMPSPSPTQAPTTLQPTPLSVEPTLLPSISPSMSPTTPTPSASPSSLPSPSPSAMPSLMPTPSPTQNPILPSLAPTQSPTESPSTPLPTSTPSAMPSPSPSLMPSTIPSPRPTALPTTAIPSPSPSTMPSPSPSTEPTAMPSPSPSPLPTVMPSSSPTAVPTVTCPCLIVEDPTSELNKYVGLYRWNNTYSPNSDRWMWERLGDSTKELIYFSKFGTAAARWVIKGSTYGEWAETSADPSEAKPPTSGVWLIHDNGGNFYKGLAINCSQCEVTPAPTPDPTESPTTYPTSFSPTASPTPMPSYNCRVLNITDLTNGYYNGYFEMDVLPYNDKHKWTDLKTGEKLHWADIAMFEHEGAVENIWMLGFEADEGEKDSHFLILVAASNEAQPPIESVEHWKEYTFNAYTNQTSEILINCEDTWLPTVTPTRYPTEPLCTELFVETCCDPVYTEFDGAYTAVTHRGGKDMYANPVNGYSIYYTEDNDGDYWSIRSENESLIWVENSAYNGAYPPWDSHWDLENHPLDDLKVMVMINCSESFSPSSFPTSVPTKQPTTEPISLEPSPMPTSDPTSHPTDTPTEGPTEACIALEITEQTGTEKKYEGTYSRLQELKNGKTEWMNYVTGASVYWIGRGIYANSWIIRAADGYHAMTVDNIHSVHPPIDAEWSSLGGGLLPGDEFIRLHSVCTTQPPAPAPTIQPSAGPTCEGNAIYIEDPCDANITGGLYSGYYNYEYTHDGKNVYVRVDGEYEVLYIADNLFSDLWMMRSHDSGNCEEFWVVDGYGNQAVPPADAFWDSYTCGCDNIGYQYRCNFRITCMHTKAPVPTEDPTSTPTDAPIDTLLPTAQPSPQPTPNPTSEPTSSPTYGITPAPTHVPTTLPPTMSPLPYECAVVDLQPCINITDRVITFYERAENQFSMNSNYHETKLYTEQKGYNFIVEKDIVLHEAGMAFTSLASYQTVTVRVFHSSTLIYESGYSLTGKGDTDTVGIPRGDYYTFRNMNLTLHAMESYSVVFVIHCPATKTSTAHYPLCAPHHEIYSIGEFGSRVANVYAYGEKYELPTQSDLYAPFVRICHSDA